jgi:hypothetical protein
VLRPVWERTGGRDGYVSLEVDPGLADDTEATLEQAVELHDAVGRPNVYIKIPATVPGLSAIEDSIARGVSINVTLIFSLERYDEVLTPEAYGFIHHNFGFEDTLAKDPAFWSFNSGAVSKISNQFAAMPSVHCAWALWCAIALVPRLRRRWAKLSMVRRAPAAGTFADRRIRSHPTSPRSHR